MSLNSVSLHGRMTADPELEQLGNNGISRCRFRIAVTRDFKNKETNEYDSDFFTCECWRGTADFVERNFRKGQEVIVHGRLTSNSYEDRNGESKTFIFVQAQSVYFAGPKKEPNNSTPQTSAAPQYQEPTPMGQVQIQDLGYVSADDDDLPF